MKNKKKNILGIITTAIVFSFTSCTNDFVEVNPNSSVPATSFWKTGEEAVTGVNSIYNALAFAPSQGLFGGTFMWMDVITDDSFCLTNANASANGSWAGYANGLETPAGSNSYHTRIWPAFYKVIARCNNVLARVPSVDMDGTLKKRLLAEAKFLRAYSYHRLNIFFGEVPLLIKAPTENDPLPAKAPYAEIRAQIVKDLTEAAADLPNTYPNSDIGRITKGAALTCLMQVYMFDSKWTEATAAAQQVMNLGVYQLLPKYSDIWKYGNEETVESIWEIHYGDPAGGKTAQWGDFSFPSPHGGGPAGAADGFVTPQQQLVNEYESAIDTNNDGVMDVVSKFDPSTITSLFDTNQYKNRDPRLYESVYFQGAPYFATTYDNSFSTIGSGYHWKKYNTGLVTQFPNGNADYNTIVYRYAYVLLGYAESKNEATGPDATVYAAVNQVRQRAKMPALAAGLTKDQMRDAIRHERRVEFAGENQRHEDLRRWGLWKQAIQNRGINNGRQIGSASSTNIADFRILFPIPKEEIDANPNMKQNPGY